MQQASALQTPSRKPSLSLGVPSPRDLSRRSSLEVPTQTPSKGESGLSSPNSAPECMCSDLPHVLEFNWARVKGASDFDTLDEAKCLVI
jgi:hypothetical protein